MTHSKASFGTDTGTRILRRLNVLVALLAVVAALLGVLVAHQISESFVPVFLVLLLFGLGVTALVQSLLD